MNNSPCKLESRHPPVQRQEADLLTPADLPARLLPPAPALSSPERARGGSGRKEREAFANKWGLSTRRCGPTPEGWQMLDRAERLCCECAAALEKGGDEAAEVAALACLAFREWQALMACIADAFGDRRCVVYRYAPALSDAARIKTALERFPPDEDHWQRAWMTLARKTWGPTLDADPVVLMLRAIHGCEATPCDQVLRALCEALRWWVCRHDTPRLPRDEAARRSGRKSSRRLRQARDGRPR